MIKNLAGWDRGLRVAGALALIFAAFLAPLEPLVRIAAFGGTAAYLLFSALSGTCLGYKLLGRSTCPTRR